MKWLKGYQNLEVCLVGDDELTIGRNPCLQILYEFDIVSASLPNMNDSNMASDYVVISQSVLSFDVPPCPKNRRLKGLNITFKYTLSGDDWAWFAKISTTNGVDLMYHPRVFGKPAFGEVGIWFSYWPIGNILDVNVGDKVNVSIEYMSGFFVHECGASLVYTEDQLANEASQNKMGIIGGNLFRFQLSTGAYYLCRRDFFELVEVERLTDRWFSRLVGYTVDDTEIRGWKKTGRPQLYNRSITELNTVNCIIHGPESEEIYNIAERVKSSIVDKPVESSILGETSETAKKPYLEIFASSQSDMDLKRLSASAVMVFSLASFHLVLCSLCINVKL